MPAREWARRAERTGGAGRGRAPAESGGGAGERRQRVAAPSGCTPGSGPRPGSRRAGGSGCPLSASSASSRRRPLPSHKRVLRAPVRNVTGGSRGEEQTQEAGREHRCPALRCRGAEKGTGQGKEGTRGEAGQGQAPPARKAQALGHPGTAAATAGMRPGRATSPRSPHP